MSSMCDKPRLITMSTVLLLGVILGFSLPFTYQTPTYNQDRMEIKDLQGILTSDSQILELNMTYATYRVNIVELVTNDTSISIKAYNPDKFLDIQNVSFIHDVPLTIYSNSPEYNDWNEWSILIVRDANDVNISVVAEFHYYYQAEVLLSPLVNFGFYGIPFALIALYWIIKIETDCRIHRTGDMSWERKQGPLAIIVLILIASLLVTPMIVIVCTHSFTVTNSSYQTYSAELTTGTLPKVFGLRDITENTDGSVFIQTENKTVKLLVQGSEGLEDIAWNVTENCNLASNGWWIQFRNNTYYFSIVLFRVNDNVTAHVLVGRTWTEFSPVPEIEMYIGLSVVGVIPLSLAYLRAYRIDKYFKTDDESDRDEIDEMVDEYIDRETS